MSGDRISFCSPRLKEVLLMKLLNFSLCLANLLDQFLQSLEVAVYNVQAGNFRGLSEQDFGITAVNVLGLGRRLFSVLCGQERS